MRIWGGAGRADGRRSPEKDAQTAIKRLLRLRRIPFWDTSQPRASKITPGLPDLLAFLPVAGLVFVEVKAPGISRLSPAQEQFLACCQTAGVPYYVVHSAAEMETLL